MIWNKYKEDFIEDYLFIAKNINASAIYGGNIIALIYIEDKLQELRRRILLHYGIPVTIRYISPLSNAFIRKLHIILKN